MDRYKATTSSVRSSSRDDDGAVILQYLIVRWVTLSPCGCLDNKMYSSDKNNNSLLHFVPFDNQ
jgi:hypothetical protein